MKYGVNHPQVINEIIDGEAIMIDLATGSYYSLDSVGAQIWTLLEESRPVDYIVAELGRLYDAPEPVIRTAVDNLLEQLTLEQLITPDTSDVSAPATPPAVEPAVREPFSAPKLEKFTDMQDLILLDPVHEVGSRGWPHAPEPDRHAAS